MSARRSRRTWTSGAGNLRGVGQRRDATSPLWARPRTFGGLAGAVLLLALCAIGHAQEAAAVKPADTSTPAKAETGARLDIDERGTVELHVQGADIRQVLKLLSTPAKINIIATKEVQGTVTADLYGVTFQEALEAVLTSAGFGYARKGNFVYVYTQKQLEDVKAATRLLSVRVFRLNYITAADAKALITPVMSTDGTVSLTPAAKTGITASSADAGGNAHANPDLIIVRDYPENVEKAAAILRDVDVRPQQVLIEATILRATLEEDNALGIDFNALAGVDFRSLSSTSTGITSVAPGDVPTAGMDNAKATFRTDFNSKIDPGGLTIGFISNQVAFFVRALEGVSDVSVLANPKLLVINKQRGEILVGRRDGYLTTTVTETTATQTVEFIETGTKLLVRPYVATDGHVRLEIHPADSTGGLTVDQLPYEVTTECTSNVLVKDGHTIVIAGLFREMTDNKRSQVPYLGNIPIAGNLFRRRVEETKREEVIVLITPHIIKQAADEVVCEQLKEQVERFRVGMRQGLMWFGRERLAQGHMRWARQHLAGGDVEKATWDVNMALSLEPRMEQAIRMKERLTNEAIWAHESRYSSAHYIIQRMIMQEMGRPVEEVIPPLRPRDEMKLHKKIRDAFGMGPRPELPLNIPARPQRPAGGAKAVKPSPTTRPAKVPVEAVK